MLCKTTLIPFSLIPLCKIHRFLLCIGEEKSCVFVYQITTDNLASQFLNFINPANFSFPILVSNFSHTSWKILLYLLGCIMIFLSRKEGLGRKLETKQKYEARFRGWLKNNMCKIRKKHVFRKIEKSFYSRFRIFILEA